VISWTGIRQEQRMWARLKKQLEAAPAARLVRQAGYL